MTHDTHHPRLIENRRGSFSSSIAKLITLVMIAIAGCVFGSAQASDVQLAWDTVPDSRVSVYQVRYGSTSKRYDNQVTATGPSATVPGLVPGRTYYFAIRACARDGITCSSDSNEVSTTIPYAIPVAGFAADAIVGTAPLAVGFTDQSTGAVEGWTWTFGDGTSSTVQSPRHTYQTPGTYSVSLIVAGAGRTSSATRTGYIQVLPPAPVAEFAVNVRSGFAPLTVTFYDRSNGRVDDRNWSFGDGGTSTAAPASHTYTAPGIYTVTLQVSNPGGESTAYESDFIEVTAPTPVANFATTIATGATSLTLGFQDNSSGQITTRHWDFGDGYTSLETSPSHTYTSSGHYDVNLTVSGPSGSDTLTRSVYVRGASDLPLEIGEIQVNHEWQRIEYETAFNDPIVVVKTLGGTDSDPAVLRVRGIDATGFWVRVQEWAYLDGNHPSETASYLVMERGRYQLPDGAWVEAGRVQTPASNSWLAKTFSRPFSVVPVVFTTITSFNETDAAVTRSRGITVRGFSVVMQEAQSSNQSHGSESIDYIACEPSIGQVNGMQYAVGLMNRTVSSAVSLFVYPVTFAQPPRFLADIQNIADFDVGNLRWSDRDETALDIWVSEEQSKDLEVTHGAEKVGYLLAGPAQ